MYLSTSVLFLVILKWLNFISYKQRSSGTTRGGQVVQIHHLNFFQKLYITELVIILTKF